MYCQVRDSYLTACNRSVLLWKKTTIRAQPRTLEHQATHLSYKLPLKSALQGNLNYPILLLPTVSKMAACFTVCHLKWNMLMPEGRLIKNIDTKLMLKISYNAYCVRIGTELEHSWLYGPELFHYTTLALQSVRIQSRSKPSFVLPIMYFSNCLLTVKQIHHSCLHSALALCFLINDSYCLIFCHHRTRGLHTLALTCPRTVSVSLK